MVTIEANSIEEGLVKVAQHLGSEILSQASQNLIDGNHIDTGQLLQSGELILTNDGCIVKWGINYADYVEFGREPGSFPPIEPIYEWCKRKLNIPEEEAKQVAFMICRKIEKQGIEPVAYARNAIDTVLSRYG